MAKKKIKATVALRPKKPQNKKGVSKPKSRYLFLGLGFLGLGMVSLLGYRYWKTSRDENVSVDFSPSSVKDKPFSKSKKNKRRWKDDSFPLSFNAVTNMGSAGPRVLQLQGKLNLKYNAGLVADGKFGPLTKEVLLAKGYKAAVDTDAFNRIVDGEATLVFDPKKIAGALWKNSNAGASEATLLQLGLMKDTADYQSVNTAFKTNRDPSDYLHAHTLVTHLLDFAFKDNPGVKAQIKKEFTRMGLLEKSGQWSLSGFGKLSRLVTLKDTYVRDIEGNLSQVKRNTILGLEQYSRQGLTWFKDIEGNLAAVPSRDVHYSN